MLRAPRGVGGSSSYVTLSRGFQVRSRCLNVAGTPRGWGKFKLCYPQKWFSSEVEVFECAGTPRGWGELKLRYPQ